MVNDKRVTVSKRNDGYYSRITENRKIILKKLDPQPEESEILIIRRVYSTHKHDHSFKRRITFFEQVPEHLKGTGVIETAAVVEYAGKMPENGCHGNSKKPNTSYVRPHPEVRTQIKTDLKNRKRPRDIYIDMIDNDDIHKTAKKIRQVHDMNYKESLDCRDKPCGTLFADELQHVIFKMCIQESLI